MKHYEVDFENAEGERCVLSAELPDEIIAKARGIDFFRDVFVVRKLYQDGVPAGFLHVPRSVREIQPQ